MCGTHARLRGIWHQPVLEQFRKRLLVEFEEGRLCINEDNVVSKDFGCQDKLRSLLSCVEPAWLLPGLAVVLHVEPTLGADSLFHILCVGKSTQQSELKVNGREKRSRDRRRRDAQRCVIACLGLLALLDEVRQGVD